MACCVSSAAANRLSISNKNWRITWARLVYQDASGNNIATCPVTMEGSFHSATIRKVLGALIGYVTRATAGRPCNGGALTVNQSSLPWHITYEGFGGILPNITEIFLLLRKINVTTEILGFRCGYGRPEDNLNVVAQIEAGTKLVRLEDEAAGILTKLSGGILCPGTVKFSEPSEPLTLLGTTTKITITLI